METDYPEIDAVIVDLMRVINTVDFPSRSLARDYALKRCSSVLTEVSGKPLTSVNVLPLTPPPWAAIRETLDELFGKPTNKHERGRRAKATSLIAESLGFDEGGGDVAREIRARRNRWREVFPTATITDIALASRWSDLRPPARRLAANEKPGWYEDDRRFVPNPELVRGWAS